LVKVSIVGYGYWGPNLVRNFVANERCEVISVCDVDERRIAAARKHHPALALTTSVDHVVYGDADLVAVAVPLAAHFPIAKRAIQAGKHVLIEKPMCCSVAEADELIALAARHGVRIFVDHTFVYSPPVRRIAEEVWSGNLGTLLYYDSVRVNLGLFSRDASVTWDLAPHDLSILDHITGGALPDTVACTEITHFDGHRANLAYLTLRFPKNFIAHVHVNWLAPVKVRQILLGGTKRMLVYDDTQPMEKIRIYDDGVTIPDSEFERIHEALVQYRTGDMHAPRVDNTEALAFEVASIVACLLDGAEPIADHRAGRRVVQILEAATSSSQRDGTPVVLKGSQVDEPASATHRVR
jgi:predicted dehydrogenase